MATFPQVGGEFGRYRLVRQLGQGGMGIVYEALDTTLERPVALKIMLPNLSVVEDYRQRFSREASALAKMRSRHIVQIYEYGENDGSVYLVTELFPDGDLHRWLDSHGPLDREDALTLVAQISEGLQDAHDAGVIHRDVKPSNVLLWDRAGTLIPYLCDFGIAGVEDSVMTRSGSVIGSLGYMAPERHLGQPADAAGDVYSAGCLLWATLTGHAPFSGTDFQLMQAHLGAPVPRIPVNRPLDARVNDLLEQAMAKDPDQRFRSARAFRQALLDVLAETPGSTPAPAPLERPVEEVTKQGKRLPQIPPATPGPTPGPAPGQAPEQAPGQVQGATPGFTPGPPSGPVSGQPPASTPTPTPHPGAPGPNPTPTPTPTPQPLPFAGQPPPQGQQQGQQHSPVPPASGQAHQPWPARSAGPGAAASGGGQAPPGQRPPSAPATARRPSPQPPPKPSRPRRRRGPLFLGLGIFVVLALVAGGLVYWLNRPLSADEKSAAADIATAMHKKAPWASKKQWTCASGDFVRDTGLSDLKTDDVLTAGGALTDSPDWTTPLGSKLYGHLLDCTDDWAGRIADETGDPKAGESCLTDTGEADVAHLLGANLAGNTDDSKRGRTLARLLKCAPPQVVKVHKVADGDKSATLRFLPPVYVAPSDVSYYTVKTEGVADQTWKQPSGVVKFAANGGPYTVSITPYVDAGGAPVPGAATEIGGLRPFGPAAAPTVEATGGYRSVRFVLTPPAQNGRPIKSTQYYDGKQWVDGTSYTKTTTQGGQRACTRVRTVVDGGSGNDVAGPGVQQCGRSKPRVVRFTYGGYKTLPKNKSCTSGCYVYNVSVSGFKAYDFAKVHVGTPWPSANRATVIVGKDGKGTLIDPYTANYRVSGTVEITVGGAKGAGHF